MFSKYFVDFPNAVAVVKSKNRKNMDYQTFIEAMDELAMGIGDIADRLEISIEEIKKWESLESVPQEAIDLYEFEKENQIIED